jgi:hypothetical protein
LVAFPLAISVLLPSLALRCPQLLGGVIAIGGEEKLAEIADRVKSADRDATVRVAA